MTSFRKMSETTIAIATTCNPSTLQYLSVSLLTSTNRHSSNEIRFEKSKMQGAVVAAAATRSATAPTSCQVGIWSFDRFSMLILDNQSTFFFFVVVVYVSIS
jgi:hypothetical protein